MACPRDLVDLLLPDPNRPAPLMEKLTDSDKAEIEKIVRRTYKDKDFEEIFLKLFKNTMSSFYQTMYTRKGLWRDSLNTRPQ